MAPGKLDEYASHPLRFNLKPTTILVQGLGIPQASGQGGLLHKQSPDLRPHRIVESGRPGERALNGTCEVLLVRRDGFVAAATCRDNRQIGRVRLVEQNARGYVIPSLGGPTTMGALPSLPFISETAQLVHAHPKGPKRDHPTGTPSGLEPTTLDSGGTRVFPTGA